MTKEQLTEMGLTEEQATKVMESLNGNFVTKTRFNEVNTELNQAKNTLKDRDSQLETLKKSTGDVEALNKKITELQAENKTKDEQHQAEIKRMKFDTALNAALVGAKARNPETVKPLLKAFLEKAELDGESIKGLDAEIKKLTDSDDTKFLFDGDSKQDRTPGFKGVKPGENPNKNKPGGAGEAPKTLFDAVKSAYDNADS
jgi:TolA-binding protein